MISKAFYHMNYLVICVKLMQKHPFEQIEYTFTKACCIFNDQLFFSVLYIELCI